MQLYTQDPNATVWHKWQGDTSVDIATLVGKSLAVTYPLDNSNVIRLVVYDYQAKRKITASDLPSY